MKKLPLGRGLFNNGGIKDKPKTERPNVKPSLVPKKNKDL